MFYIIKNKEIEDYVVKHKLLKTRNVNNINAGFSLIELIVAIAIVAFTYVWSAFYIHGLGITLTELFYTGVFSEIGEILMWKGSVYNYLIPAAFVFISLTIGRLADIAEGLKKSSTNPLLAVFAIIFRFVKTFIEFISSALSVSYVIALIAMLADKCRLYKIEELLYFGSMVNIIASCVIATLVQLLKKMKDIKKKKTTKAVLKANADSYRNMIINLKEYDINTYNHKFVLSDKCFVLIGNHRQTKEDSFATYLYNDREFAVISADKQLIEKFASTEQNKFGEYVALVAKQEGFAMIGSVINASSLSGYVYIDKDEQDVVIFKDQSINQQPFTVYYDKDEQSPQTTKSSLKFDNISKNGTFSFGQNLSTALAGSISDNRTTPEKDFIAICDLIKKFGYFDLTNETELVTLAYAIQGTYDYQPRETYDKTISLWISSIDVFIEAQEKMQADCTENAALLAQDFATRAGQATAKDDDVSEEEFELIHERYEKICQTCDMVASGYVKQPHISFALFTDLTHAPKWFKSAAKQYVK